MLAFAQDAALSTQPSEPAGEAPAEAVPGDGAPDDEDAPDEGAGGDSDAEEPPAASKPVTSRWIPDDWEQFRFGDQTFTINLGVTLPLGFSDETGKIKNNVFVGGTGSLSYDFFLHKWWFIGGSFGGSFAQTISENFLFQAYYGARVGFQPAIGRFEFPLTFFFGGNTQKYLDADCATLFVKPGVGALFRATESWSFGVTCAYWLVPQLNTSAALSRNDKTSQNAVGHFLEISATARYHF